MHGGRARSSPALPLCAVGAKFAWAVAAGDLFDPSTHKTSGGLPAENLASASISQDERTRERDIERERDDTLGPN